MQVCLGCARGTCASRRRVELRASWCKVARDAQSSTYLPTYLPTYLSMHRPQDTLAYRLASSLAGILPGWEKPLRASARAWSPVRA